MVTGSRIVVIGSGNVATHMAQALDRVADVCCVYSRHALHAAALARKLKGAVATDDATAVPRDADFYIIAVKDDAVADVARAVGTTNGIWAHTSGSVPADVFKGLKQHYGVFYPLQTFNMSTEVDFSKVPMLVEGDSDTTAEALERLARAVSGRVSRADSVARGKFHIAAVFACNFANYMWSVADRLLRDDGFDITYLEPLLRVTLENALTSSPDKAQTGPARRGDTGIMARHMASLSPDDAAVYDTVSKQIMKHFSNEQN